MWEWLRYYSDIWLSDSLFTSLIASLLLDIPLDALLAWNLDWRVELPDIEEWLRGVLIKLIPVRISEVAKEISVEFEEATLNVEKLIEMTFEEWFAEEAARTRLTKCVYGRSRYGECYVDPEAVRELLRATLWLLIKSQKVLPTQRTYLLQMARSLNVSEELLRDLFDRAMVIEEMKVKAPAWDYGWWDYSYWDKDGPRIIRHVDFDLRVVEKELVDIVDPWMGGWWDYSHWDFCHWLGETPETMHPVKERLNPVFELRDRFITDFISRINVTHLAVANYTLPEERERFKPSPRVETYALPVAHARHIEALVDSILDRMAPNAPPTERRMYQLAAQHLYSLRYSDNKPYAAAFKAMTEDEFRAWWIGYWEAQGLRRDALEEIWRTVKPVADAFGARRVEEKLRLLRQKLRGLR